jgi:hypothetical protein
VINFTEDDKYLILEYTSEYQSVAWIDRKLELSGEHTFHRTFTVAKKNLIHNRIENSNYDDDVRRFVIGNTGDNYRSIDKGVLGLKYDLLISNSITLRKEFFVAQKDISIFGRIDNLVSEQIVVGGDRNNTIPEAEFAHLLKNFPTSTELRKYADSRVAQELSDYFETMSDAECRLVNYMNRTRNSKPIIKPKDNMPIRTANELEMEKYIYLRDELTSMLTNPSSYRELRWQEVVANLFLLIFPQYIAVLKNVSVKELYSNPLKPTVRKFDLALVDANGSIDLIEIKRPFDNSLVSKRTYRDNYVPHGELSGAIMQAEKYLFYLNKGGRDVERAIEAKYKKQLPVGIEIKIANPKAIILNGRDHNLSSEQKFDLGFIRKKYSNMIDILSYDDLLRRIDNIIETLKLRAGV